MEKDFMFGSAALTTKEIEEKLALFEAKEENESTLNLSNCEITSEQLARVINIVRHNPYLQTLYLVNVGLDDAWFKLLLKAAKKNQRTNLTFLHLDHNHLTAECIEELRDFLRFNTVLTTITIKKNKLGNTGIIKFNAIVHQLRERPGSDRNPLQTFLISHDSYNEITQSAIDELQNSGMTILPVKSHVNKTESAIDDLLKKFETCQTEDAYLNLSHYALSPKHLSRLVHIVQVNPHLIMLNLTDTGLIDYRFKHLLQALSKIEPFNLTHLYLDYNYLTAECMGELKNFLQSKNLKKITLSANNFDDNSIVVLCTFLSQLSKKLKPGQMLLKVFLGEKSYNPTTQTAIEELQNLGIDVLEARSTPATPIASMASSFKNRFSHIKASGSTSPSHHKEALKIDSSVTLTIPASLHTPTATYSPSSTYIPTPGNTQSSTPNSNTKNDEVNIDDSTICCSKPPCCIL